MSNADKKGEYIADRHVIPTSPASQAEGEQQ